MLLFPRRPEEIPAPSGRGGRDLLLLDTGRNWDLCARCPILTTTASAAVEVSAGAASEVDLASVLVWNLKYGIESAVHFLQCDDHGTRPSH